jgi:hypothetical protein
MTLKEISDSWKVENGLARPENSYDRDERPIAYGQFENVVQHLYTYPTSAPAGTYKAEQLKEVWEYRLFHRDWNDTHESEYSGHLDYDDFKAFHIDLGYETRLTVELIADQPEGKTSALGITDTSSPTPINPNVGEKETVEQAASKMWQSGSYKNDERGEAIYCLGADFGAHWQLHSLQSSLTEKDAEIEKLRIKNEHLENLNSELRDDIEILTTSKRNY